MEEHNPPAERLDKQEREILLEIFRERYQHVRHLQEMRATYFNLYVAVIGFSIAALVAVYTEFKGLAGTPAVTIGGLTWTVSILTMMRAERWGGHISHDLRTIREIQNIFASKYEFVSKVIPVNPKVIRSLAHDRPLWNRNRSIETPASMLGAILGAAFVAYALPAPTWVRTVVGLALFIISVLLWRGEVANLKRRHAKCCLSKR